MRVSKTVREYIEDRVAQKLNIKYKPLLKAHQEAENNLADLRDKIARAMADLGESMIASAIADHPALIRTDRDLYLILKNNMYNMIKREASGKSFYQRKEDEKAEIVRNIIVTLELGGTKADLENMLAEI